MRFMQLCCKHNNRGKIRFERFSHGHFGYTSEVIHVRITLQCKSHAHVIYRKKNKWLTPNLITAACLGFGTTIMKVLC